MADRRFNEYSIGHPGRLTYSYGIHRAEDCGWQTVRDHQIDVPRFREVGPHHECIAASRAPTPKPPCGTWHEHQKQKKWLLKNHAEAALGNDVLEGVLALENSPYRRGQTARHETQFTVGEMADISNPNNVVSVPLLAMATGPAADVLRLLRPMTDTGISQLRKDENAMLQLPDHSEYHETLWTGDVGTIRRVQSIVSTRRFEPLRWLVVVRDFGTTVFRPEYRKIPLVQETPSGSYPQRPSYIDPNPLFTIPRSQTGHELQSDVAFNVGIKSKPPQIAFIDEGGSWSVWDIYGTRNRTSKRPKPRLTLCGNIQKGVRKTLLRTSTVKPQWHIILWVGCSNLEEGDGVDDEDDGSTPQFTSSFPPLQRSSTLLLGNQKILRLLDLDTNAFLPDLHFTADNSSDIIYDVHADTQDPRYFYVVTTSRLFVVAQLSTTGLMQSRVVKKPLILHSLPHFRARLDGNLKIALTTSPPSSGKRTSFVFLYSQNSNWYDIFCFSFPKGHPDRVFCYHDKLVSKMPLGMNGDLNLQTLYPSPVLMATLPESMFMDESRLSPGHRTRFFQLFSFGTNLSLNYCVGVFSSLARNTGFSSVKRLSIQEQPVSESHERPQNRRKFKKFSSQELERNRAVRFLSSRFVTTDSFAESQYRNPVRTDDKDDSRSVGVHRHLRRMIQPLYERLHSSLQELTMSRRELSSVEMDIYGAAPFDPVYVAVQTSLETKRLPLRTLFEIVENVKTPWDISETSEEWHAEIEQLSHVDPAVEIRGLIKPNDTLHYGSSLQELVLSIGALTVGAHRDASNSGLDFADFAIRRIACELYLSRFGITYLPTDLAVRQAPTSSDAPHSTQFTDDMIIDTNENYRLNVLSPSLPPSLLFESQASSRASTPASTAPSVLAKSDTSDSVEDWPIALVRTLTGSGKFLPHGFSEILSMWREGEDPANHVFTIDKDTEITPGMRKRAKQEARDARKRKRKETLLQLQRESNLAPLTQPLPETRFSSQVMQPPMDSSQARLIPSSSIVAMSQPAPGTFGGRSGFERPKKKAKRKGGF